MPPHFIMDLMVKFIANIAMQSNLDINKNQVTTLPPSRMSKQFKERKETEVLVQDALERYVFDFFFFLVKCYDNLSLLCQVFEAERMVTRVGNFHRNCFSCIECNKKLDSTTCCEGKIDDNRKDNFFICFVQIYWLLFYILKKKVPMLKCIVNRAIRLNLVPKPEQSQRKDSKSM